MSKLKSVRAARAVVSKRSGLLNRMLLASASMAVLGAAGAAHAQSLSTTYAGGNNQAGNLFDIQASTDLLLTGIDQSFINWNPGWTYYVYIRQGGLSGDLSEFTLLGSVTDFTANPEGTPTHIPLTLNYGLYGGQRYGLYVTTDVGSAAAVSYTNGSYVGAVAAQNDDLTIYEGYGAAYPMAGFYQPRIWNGTLSYAPAVMCVDSTEGDDTCAIDAATTVFGTGDALGGTDTLQLSGAVNFTFNADTLGVNLLNFEQLQKTGASNVTLTGSAEMPVFIDEGTLTVAGSVTSNGSNSAVIVTGDGAQVDVLAGGLVDGGTSYTGVYVQAADAGVTNAGTIRGYYGAYFEGDGSVTNQSGGLIQGTGNAVVFMGAGEVTNAGTIRSTGVSSGNAPVVWLGQGGTVTNQAGGLIDGGTGGHGVYAGGHATVTNDGTIIGANGVFLSRGGEVTNTGVITGTTARGVQIQSGEGELTNSGTITGVEYGARLYNGGTVINGPGGTITGFVGLSGGTGKANVNQPVDDIHALDVFNDGAIYGSNSVGGVGVKLEAGGSVANREGAVIQAATGVDVVGGLVQLTNQGSIIGANGGIGVRANGGMVSNSANGMISGSTSVQKIGADDLSLNNYGALTGQVVHAGTGLLTLWNFENASITGANSAVDSQGGRLDIDNAGLIQGGVWGVVGRNADDRILNSGTIKGVIQDGVILAAGGELTNSGLVTGGYRGVVGTDAEVHNQAGGVIVGGSNGVDLYGASTLDNAGFIAAGTYADGVVTLGGYDGVRMNGGTVINRVDGAIMSGAYAGVYSYGNEASVTNAGSITSDTGNGLYLRSTVNEVTNLAGGVISGGIGVNAGGGLSLDNAGLIKGTNGNAIFVESGAATITNSGSVISTNPSYTGIYTNAGGSLTNLAGGTINGGYDGVRFGGSAVVDNAGSIVNQNAGRIAVLLSGGGTVTNREGGSIAGKFRGVYFGANGTVTNDGTISAVTDNAVSFIGDGAVTNSATGVISSAGRNSGGWGVWGAGLLQVDNAGRIDGESGVVFTGTGGVTNRAGGVIEGRLYGVLSYPDAGVGAVTVDNAGTISGGTGVAFAAGGTVVNRAAGEIGGEAGYGVLGSAGSERVENAGRISGSLAALDLGGGNDTLVMFTGGTLGGYALGGAGADALILDGAGAGSLNVGLLGGWETQTKLGTGAWTLTGADAMGLNWSVAAGTLRAAGGHSIGDGATVTIASGATLALDAGETIAALSGAGTVDLGRSTLTVGGDGANSSFDGVIVDMGGWEYAGSWAVSDGPAWDTNPAVYSGQEAAALLFGGEAADYSISTVSTDPNQINFRAWMDGWGDSQYLFNPAPQDLHVDVDGDGYANPGGQGTSYSAYVSDHGGGGINYAFRGGAGSLVKTGAGVLTLNGANTFSGVAYVQQGTLRIGGDERLSDNVTLTVASGATFDLQAYDETVGKVEVSGTIAGTGTLSAGEYWLVGARIDGNLGSGTLIQLEGETWLNGVSGADMAELVGGTLTLGASERFDDAALVQVDEDATWALDGWDETIDQLWGEGVVDLGEGGSLTLGWDDGSSTFAGEIEGVGDVTKIGDGTWTLLGTHDFDGALIVEGGEVRLAAILAGDVQVRGGLLSGYAEIGGDLKVTGGVVSPGGGIGYNTDAVRSAGPDLGVFFTNSLTVSGGTLAFGFAGADLNYASDHIVVDHAVRLSGGTVDLRPVSAVSQYGYNQQYLLIEGGSLSGQFANLSGDFSANAYESQLYQRLRYDIVPGGVVLEVRRMVDWSEGTKTEQQGAVGEALKTTMLDGSDEWTGVLETLLDLTPEERREALADMSGEGVANVSASAMAFGDRFNAVMQGHMNAGGGAGAGGTGGTAFAALPFGQGARTDVLGGALNVAEAGLERRPGAWAEAFVVDSSLKGRGGAADADSRGGGFASGMDVQVDPVLRLGFALGYSDMRGDTTDRSTASEGQFWHMGVYASYEDGPWFGGASFSRLTGDVDIDRTIGLGPLSLDVAGSTEVTADNLSVNFGRRWRLGAKTELRAGVSGAMSEIRQDAYTETGAGGLSLNVEEIERRLFVGELGGRVTHDLNEGRLKPYAGAGVVVASGDLHSLANVGFSGAPTGTGTFVVEGAELPPEWAHLEAGLAFKPRDSVWVSVGYDGALSERLQEHRGTVKVSLQW